MVDFDANRGKVVNRAAGDSASAIDPTPEQIAIRTAAIRAGWSDRQRQSRRVTRVPTPLPPLVRVEDWLANLASDRRN